MTIKKLLLIGTLLPNFAFSQSFYDRSVVQTIEIFFPSSSLDSQLDALASSTEEYLLADSVRINGITYDSVGVKYKGNSSYNASNNKNPLHIKLDYIDNQDHQGYTDIKLQNGYQDPSMIREVLSYAILEQFMDCPKANFANVYINGTLRGLYSNAESIDEKFVADQYYDNLGSFFKCNPVGGAGPGSSGSPDLKYLGTDSTSYSTSYELESDYGWSDLIDLTNTLNNNFTAIETKLDIDRAIWMLAFNNVLVNLDSYNGTFRQNYYLYEDLNDRFVPTVWDLNMSFGGFPGGGSAPTTLDPFSNSSSANHPLIVKILGNATYKKMYMAHIRTILNDIFASGDYLTTANTLRTTIDASVQADPYKFYTYTQFQNSLTTNVTGGGGGGGGGFTIYGIQNLMGARVTFFQSNTDFNYVAPTIVSHSFSNPTPNYGDNNTINVTCSNETEVYFGYRFAIEKNFTRVQLFDDGAHNDGAAGDHVFGTNIQMNGSYMQYFIYAQNGTAGIFSPERAEHEYHTLQITVPTTVDNEVVINEIMAKNTDYVFDNYGQDDDWLELFNTTSSAKSLVGLYLTDDNTNLTKWSFPANSFIAPNDYYIVWVDDDSTQSGVHANFKISSTAETIYLTNGATIFDTVTSGVLASNEAWARCPDAGVFTIAVPTFDASNNCFLTISETETKETFTVFPVPAVDNTTIRIENSDSYELSVVDMQGRIIYASDLSSGDNLIDCSQWKSGVYQFVLKNEVSSETKVVSFMKQ